MSAEKNNKYAQQWTIENAKPYFEDALEYAETNEDCLCLQDAIYNSGIPYSTFYYLADNHDDLEKIKNDIQQAIIRRVNKNALSKKESSSAAASIWRMKQLGEKDQQYIEQTNKGISTEVIVSDKKTAKTLEELKQKFKDEI